MNCLFCKMVNGEIPTTVMLDDPMLMAFRDINPEAPTHLLIIPKQHIATIDDTKPDDEALLGKMILAARQLAQQEGLSKSGYRLVFNVNASGGQTVYHIHLHLLGGRQMTWPPG